VLISTSKNAMSFLFLLISTLQRNCTEQVLPRSEGEGGGESRGGGQGGEMTQTMYAHVNK
jgi:hypothetical protein